MRYTAVTAHSGCEGTPDNSMESILTGIAVGADCVEIDVRMDGEGRLWLWHDKLESYADKIPLADALKIIAESGVRVNCDLKEDGLIYATLETAEACGVPYERLIFSGSVTVSTLIEDPQIVRRARIFLNSEELCRHMMPDWPRSRQDQVIFFEENLGEIAAMMKRLGVEALNAPFKYLTDGQIAALRAAGIELSLWTVNEDSDMNRLLRQDLLGITTRKPRNALRIRSEIRNREE